MSINELSTLISDFQKYFGKMPTKVILGQKEQNYLNSLVCDTIIAGEGRGMEPDYIFGLEIEKSNKKSCMELK